MIASTVLRDNESYLDMQIVIKRDVDSIKLDDEIHDNLHIWVLENPIARHGMSS